jgi:hypothetical protein
MLPGDFIVSEGHGHPLVLIIRASPMVLSMELGIVKLNVYV